MPLPSFFQTCWQVWRDYWFLGIMTICLGINMMVTVGFGLEPDKPNLTKDGVLYFFLLRLITIWLPGIFSVGLFWFYWRRAKELKRWTRVFGVPIAARTGSFEINTTIIHKNPREGTYWQAWVTYEYQAKGHTLTAELPSPESYQEGDLLRAAKQSAQQQAQRILSERKPQPLLHHPFNPHLVVIDDAEQGKTEALAFFLVFVVPPALLVLLEYLL